MSQQFPKMPFEANRGPIRFVPGAAEAAGQLPPAVSPALTYEPYYGLKEKPFSLSADPRFLYRSPAHTPAFAELLTGIRRREGLIVLTGEIGTGKTTLIRSVLQHLDRRTFTAFVPDPFVSREDLLKMLLVDFGVVSIADLKRGSLAGASRPDLSYPLYEFLDSLVPLQAFAVLIIDEAQNLPLPLLEEIRILSDLEQREKMLQVVLVGQPELRSHLKMPEMRQVDQRISVRCELSALSLDDVAEYVRHRLSVAGGGDSRVEFSSAAIASIYRASAGVPRVINLICDRALQRGHQAQAMLIDSSLIDEAVDALGLEPPARMSSASVVAVRPVAAGARPDRATEAPKPAHVPAPQVQPSSVSIREEVTVATEFLADFAAETELMGQRKGQLRLWKLAASLVLAALGSAGMAAFWYIYFTSGNIDVSAATLPPSPGWTIARPQVAAPPPAERPGDAPAVRPLPPAPVAPPAPPLQGRFSIQVASFESRERADRLLAELTQAGFRARTRAVEQRETGLPILEVRVEGYTSAEEASQDLARIRELPGYADARLLAN